MLCPYCSAEIPKAKGKRSLPQHNWFFWLIRAAYENWPEGHGFQPTSPKELRKWLTARAGYVHRVVVHPPDDILNANRVIAAQARMWTQHMIRQIRGSHEFSWIDQTDRGFVVLIPRSLAFDQMDQDEFGNLVVRVEGQLEQIGFDIRSLLAEHKRQSHGLQTDGG